MDNKLEKHWNWQGGKSYKKYKCIICGKEFTTKSCYEKRGGNKYCSRECYYKTIKGKPKKTKRYKFKCKFCGKVILVPYWKTKKRLFCSVNCRRESIKKPKIKKICPICQKEFYVWPSGISSIYCSRKCMYIGGGKKRIGLNNGNWIDGRTPKLHILRNSKRLKRWRNRVFKKDNYTCRKCGKVGWTLNAHHIENFPTKKELRFKTSNGITFCKMCHKEFHNRYGLKNNNLEQVKEFING